MILRTDVHSGAAGQTFVFAWRTGVAALVAPRSSAVNNVTYFPHVTPVYLPLLWIDRHGEATPADLNDFKDRVSSLLVAMAVARNGGIAVATLGALLAVGFGVLAARRRSAKRDSEERAAVFEEVQHQPLLSAGEVVSWEEG